VKKVVEIWKETFIILGRYPQMFLPFLLVGIFSGIALYILYLSPQRPINLLLAPPIRAFFGEKFLHYPYNLYLLPKLYYYAHIFIGATLGILMNATACFMLKDIYYKKREPRILANSFFSLKRYLSLLGIWVIIFFLSYSWLRVMKIKGENSLFFSILSFLGVVFISTLFIYAIPAIVFEKRKIFSALGRSLGLFKKFPFLTLFLVFLPSSFYLPVIFLKRNTLFLMKHFFPEIIIFVLGIGISVSVVVDLFTATLPAILFLKEGGKK